MQADGFLEIVELEAAGDIPLHHELAPTPRHPSKLVFFGETPPAGGGETPLCRSDRLLEQLAGAEPRFVDDCERLGLRYTNVMPPEAHVVLVDNFLVMHGRRPYSGERQVLASLAA